MTAPTVVDEETVRRTRAALAEVGYPPEAIDRRDDGTYWWKPALVPHEVMWRARATSGTKECWACWQWRMDQADVDGEAPRSICESAAPFAQDCGVER
jgi:hypothetical protein